ncbi:MAG: hypothetical protein F6K31_12610 [Symploca sp. SIO2G7]|nr:hypothetical protein [Symploca sp. SIO2G7]
MGRIKFWIIALISFLLVIGGSFFKRVVAVTLCGVLGINSPVCYFLGQNRAIAASPPASESSTIIAQTDIFRNDGGGNNNQGDTDIFRNDGGNSVEPDNSEVDIFRNDGNNPNQLNNVSDNKIVFKTLGVNQISSNLIEIEQLSSEGCQYKVFLENVEGIVYQKSVHFVSPGSDICGAPSFQANFKSKGTRVEIQLDDSSGKLILDKLNKRTIRGVYRENGKDVDLGEFPIEQETGIIQGINRKFDSSYTQNQVNIQSKYSLIAQSKQERDEQVKEIICSSGRKIATGLGTIFTVGGILGALALLTVPGSAAATVLTGTVGAYFVTGQIVGWTSYLTFGGDPPILGTVVDKLSQSPFKSVKKAFDFASGINSFKGLLKESELAYDTGYSSGVREPDKGIFNEFAANLRNTLTDKTGIPFNACDKETETQTVAKCGETQIKQGGQGQDSKSFNLGATSGTITVFYEMCPNPDQLDVFYENQLIGTTGGLVSGQGSLEIPFEGSSTQATVVVRAPNNGTEWAYALFCPDQEVPRNIGKLRDCTTNNNTTPSLPNLPIRIPGLPF